MKNNHILDCTAKHEHENPICCDFKCPCRDVLPEGLFKLENVPENSLFECPWSGAISKLMYITASAAWVEVIEEKEFQVKNKKGEIKTVKTKIKKNEPWSRRTVVKPL